MEDDPEEKSEEMSAEAEVVEEDVGAANRSSLEVVKCNKYCKYLFYFFGLAKRRWAIENAGGPILDVHKINFGRP